MLTSHGKKLVLDSSDRLMRELTRYGGPWAAPLTFAAAAEVTGTGSGLLRKQVTVSDDGRLLARWTATTADAGRCLETIGLAPRADAPFLVALLIRDQPGPVEVFPGDVITLAGPLRIRVD